MLLAAGLVGGFMAGLLGIGGGVVFIAILPLVLRHVGVPEDQIVQYTIANSIFGTWFASLSASSNLIRHKEFHLKEVAWIGLGSSVFSLAVIRYIVNTPLYSKEAFNVIIIVLLLFVLIQTLRKARKILLSTPEIKSTPTLLVAGASGGTVSALSGLGGGTIIIPILHLVLKMDIKKAKSISLGVIFITTSILTANNLLENTILIESINHTGYIVWSVALPLSLGVMISSSLGVKVGRMISSKSISYIFATFILLVIIQKLADLL